MRRLKFDMSRVTRGKGVRKKQNVSHSESSSSFIRKIYRRRRVNPIRKLSRIISSECNSVSNEPNERHASHSSSKSVRDPDERRQADLAELNLDNPEDRGTHSNPYYWKDRLSLSHPLLRMSIMNHVLLGLEVVISTLLFNKFFYR